MKAVKPVEKNKINKLIFKIEDGTFDENDIDNIFMKLRAYSDGFTVFREVADFVAHNDVRNKGGINLALKYMYLRMKFFVAYGDPPKPSLDISMPFPIWVKELMELQIDKSDESQLREKFNVTKKRLSQRIDKAFKLDKKNKTATYKQNELSTESFDAIKYVMGFLLVKEAFSQDDLINELSAVLKNNNIVFNEKKIRDVADKITVCVLLLLHGSSFDFSGYKAGGIKISSTEEGYLVLRGSITLNIDGKDLPSSHDVMITNLAAETWCAQDLFHIEFPDDLCINSDFKLSSLKI